MMILLLIKAMTTSLRNCDDDSNADDNVMDSNCRHAEHVNS